MPAELTRPGAAPDPGKRDPAGRQRAIVSAAAELIAAGGVAAVTHRAVATAAGVSLGSTTQYFASIEELREAAYALLADQIDDELALMQDRLANFVEFPEQAARAMHSFLLDTRQVRADIALISAGTTDPARRRLALRWYDRLVELIASHIGTERAVAIAVYLDGATMHAGLHDEPLSVSEMTQVIRALTVMPAQQADFSARNLDSGSFKTPHSYETTSENA